MDTLTTLRMDLVVFTHALMLEAIASPERAAASIGARAAPDWPNPEIAEALPMIADDVRADLAREPLTRLMVLREDPPAQGPVVVGEIGFKSPPDAHGTIEIGYGVAMSYRGRGLATEAVDAMYAWCSGQPGVRAIVAECLPENVPSAKVLQACGFQEAGSDSTMRRWRRVNRVI